MRLTTIGASVVVGSLLLSGCGSPDVTESRVESALAPTFDNVYAQRAALLGIRGVTPQSTGSQAKCHRGPGVAAKGPGADWICQVSYTNTDRKRLTGKFELQVKANSCYVAGGPTSQVGPVTITDKAGKDVTNPAFEFDGCFDPDS